MPSLPHPLVAPLVALLAAAACTAEPPVRLAAGRSDTVVVHAREATLPVRALDAAGRARDVRDARYRREAGDAGEVSGDGRITCARSGDVAVRVARGALSTRLVVLCRPIASFVLTSDVRLLVGGPAVELPLAAVGTDGAPVLPIAGRAAVHDTRVASLDGMRVRPVAPGETEVEVDVGDCVTTVGIAVDERVDASHAMRPHQTLLAPALRLVGGEVRSWRLAPGAYELWLRTPTSTPGTSLVLAGDGMNCAALPGDAQRYRCIARDGAAVVVRHPQRAGRGRELAGDLAFRRTSDRPRGSARTARRKPQCVRRFGAPPTARVP